MKQSELAEKAGISRVSIGNYERGDRMPNVEILLKIADALEVPLAELVGFEVDDTKNVADFIKKYNLEGFERMQQIAEKTGTHIAFLIGETKEKKFDKIILEEMINDMNIEKFDNGVKLYREHAKKCIYKMWSDYLHYLLSDWYTDEQPISGSDLDLLYFSNKTSEMFLKFRSLIFSFDKIFPDRKNDDGTFEMDALDIHIIHKHKSMMVESISTMLDSLIEHYLSSSLLPGATLYMKDILTDYGDEIYYND